MIFLFSIIYIILYVYLSIILFQGSNPMHHLQYPGVPPVVHLPQVEKHWFSQAKKTRLGVPITEEIIVYIVRLFPIKNNCFVSQSSPADIVNALRCPV